MTDPADPVDAAAEGAAPADEEPHAPPTAGAPPWARRPPPAFGTPTTPGAPGAPPRPQAPTVGAPMAPAPMAPGPVAGAAPGSVPGAPGVVGPWPPQPRVVPTAAVLGAIPGSTTGAGPVERPRRQYPQFASSPLWPFLASLGVLVVGFALGIVVAAQRSDDLFSDGRSVTTEEWILVATFLGATVLALVWLYRIGANGGTYGLGLLLINVFPIDLAVANVFLSFEAPGVAIAASLYAAHYLFLYRPFLIGIWRAGDLPAEWAIIGWLPAVIASPLLLFGAWNEATVLIAVAAVLSGLSALVQIVSLLAVTIIQHVGIRADRAAVRAAS